MYSINSLDAGKFCMLFRSLLTLIQNSQLKKIVKVPIWIQIVWPDLGPDCLLSRQELI